MTTEESPVTDQPTERTPPEETPVTQPPQRQFDEFLDRALANPATRAAFETAQHRRLRRGRVSVYIEPRDLWVGAYLAPYALYVCPLPMLVIKVDR